MSDITTKLDPHRPVHQRLATLVLRVAAGPDMLRFVTLTSGHSLVIGRDRSCHLSLGDASISRHHARVTCDAQGGVVVQDLGSTNGVAVNGVSSDVSELRPGDHLEIGRVSLRLDLLGREELAHLTQVVDRLLMADRDPLTGLLTRSFVTTDLPGLVERSDRRSEPVSALFIDLDHFKTVNDRFGHLIGDEVLTAVARLVMVGVRDSDPCVRYGGEEIVAFMAATPGATAALSAERIRVSIVKHDWGRTAENLTVTASLGVAERLPAEASESWLARADRALYEAKAGGRNQVRVAPRTR